MEEGWNVLVGADNEKIVKAISEYSWPKTHAQIFGDGKAANRIVTELVEELRPSGCVRSMIWQ